MSKKKTRKSHKKSPAAKQSVQKNTVQSKAAEVQALRNKYQDTITKAERKTQVSSPDSTSAEKVVLYGNKPKATISSPSSAAYSTPKTDTSPKSSAKSSDGFIETPQTEPKKTYISAPYPVVKEVAETEETEKTEKTEEATSTSAPTFEDWQSEQKQRIEEAFEKKQAELKLKTVELELNEATKPRRRFGRWLAASFALLLLVTCGGGVWWFLAKHHSANEVEVPATSLATVEIDFGQKVLDADGNEFTPVYQRGGLRQNLFIQFADLKCNEQCTNVQNLRFASSELIPGLDYNLVGENISLTLYADFLERLEADVYELTFDYIDELSEPESKQTQKIGLHVTIEDVELVCEAPQTLQDGVCIDEKGEEVTKPTVRVLPMPEKTANSQQQSTDVEVDQGTPKPTNPAPEQPTISAEQLACERRNGPKYLTIVHWATDSERKQALAAGKIDPTITFIEGGFNTETKLATMKWVNGVCRPAVKAEYMPDSQPSIAILMSLETFHIVGGYLNAYIEKYPNQDLLVWVESDGSIRVEVVANGYVVLEY